MPREVSRSAIIGRKKVIRSSVQLLDSFIRGGQILTEAAEPFAWALFPTSRRSPSYSQPLRSVTLTLALQSVVISGVHL